MTRNATSARQAPGTGNLLAGALAALALAAAPGATAQTTASASAKALGSHPNVIMVFTDDMGFADISSFTKHKNLKVKTPNIDRLAKEGKQFF